MGIEDDLMKFDGRSVAVLRSIAGRYAPSTATIQKLLSMASGDKPGLQVGATRLLKCWLDRGVIVSQAQSAKLLALLCAELPWESRLHVLQFLPLISIGEAQKAGIYQAVMRDLSHENKFVRAWAYGTLAHLAVRFPEHAKETNEILTMGMRDETAAVKARIRNVTRASKKTRSPMPARG